VLANDPDVLALGVSLPTILGVAVVGLLGGLLYRVAARG
jgi:hypothetical protein